MKKVTVAHDKRYGIPERIRIQFITLSCGIKLDKGDFKEAEKLNRYSETEGQRDRNSKTETERQRDRATERKGGKGERDIQTEPIEIETEIQGELKIAATFFFSDYDECTNTPCLNGGTCVNNRNNFSCVCTSSYKGRKCEGSTCMCCC